MIKVNTINVKLHAQEQLDDFLNKVVKRFIYVGEECVKHARELDPEIDPTFKDDTGNLRNSIGYVVLRDGVVQLRSHISSLNEEIIEELTPKYRDGIVLIVVAGMEYAVYVERNGYDVISSAELLAERIVPKMLRKLGK